MFKQSIIKGKINMEKINIKKNLLSFISEKNNKEEQFLSFLLLNEEQSTKIKKILDINDKEFSYFQEYVGENHIGTKNFNLWINSFYNKNTKKDMIQICVNFVDFMYKSYEDISYGKLIKSHLEFNRYNKHNSDYLDYVCCVLNEEGWIMLEKEIKEYLMSD